MADSDINIDAIQSSEIAELRKSVNAIQIELAEKRPLGDILRYGTLVVLLVGGTLSFFGVSSIQSIEDGIADRVDLAVREHIREEVGVTESQLRSFYDFVSQNDANQQDFNNLLVEYRKRIQDIDGIIQVSRLEDIEGEVARITEEIRYRQSIVPNFEDDDVFKGTIHDENWRLGVVSRLKEFATSPEKMAEVDTDSWTELVDALRAAKMGSITHSLAQALPDDPGKPELQAMRYAIAMGRQIGIERDASFEALMGLVRNLNEKSPHIVLIEAWNVAEDYRRHSELIDALETSIDTRIRDGKPAISSLSLLLAESHARRGFSGDMTHAAFHLDTGLRILEQESTNSQWYDFSLESADNVFRHLGLDKELEETPEQDRP